MTQPLTLVRDRRDNSICIGINALEWNMKNGYGRYCRELVSALLLIPTRYSFTLLMDPDTSAPAGVAVVRFNRRQGNASTRTLAELLKLTWTLSRIPVNAWFFPSPLTFVPVVSRARSIMTIHDTIPWLYPHLIFSNRAQQLAWRMKLMLAIRQSARVITVSNHARESLVSYFGMAASSISVINEAPAAAFKPNLDRGTVSALGQQLGLPPDARAIVYHGAFTPHKDLRTLIGAYAKLYNAPEFDDVHLVLAGSVGGSQGDVELRSLKAMCKNLVRVRFAGSLGDADLASLLNRATLAVLPSLEEGFGLTGLEAAACGATLIATRTSALPEVLGDGAIYFEPGDENELYAHLCHLLRDSSLRRKLREKGLASVSALSWDDAAKGLIAVFDQVFPGISG